MQNHDGPNLGPEIDQYKLQTIVVTIPGRQKKVKIQSFAETVAEYLQFAETPLKFHLPDHSIHFLFDRAWYALFHAGTPDHTFDELVSKFWCDDLYRNLHDIQTSGTEIESGSLWMRRKDDLILFDDDQFATSKFDPEKFEIAN